MSLSFRLVREKLLRLPLEELVRQPLEALSHHHECARGRVAGAEVEIREPPAPAAVSTLRAEYDEVVRAHRFHLEPRLAAPACGIERLRVLHDDSFVPGAQRLGQHALALFGAGSEDT